jgi:hypothetical protein
MSLDVSLYREKIVSYDKGLTFVQENECVYDSNITHNLNTMAEKAGIYKALWRPYKLHKEFDPKLINDKAEYEFEDTFVVYARDITPTIEEGFKELIHKPEYFQEFDSPNGWGKYVNFVPFVEDYLNACKQYPGAIVKVSR